jgi:predicted lipase
MNISATQFDLGNARACARASADAYQRATISIPETDTHCLIAETPDCFVIAFRGTTSIRNWITDAEFERNWIATDLQGSTCDVHDGFLNAFESALPQLSKFLGGSPVMKIQNCKPLFITGHSLGGALAILAALELQRAGFQVAQVYTFGQPRVGNTAFKRLYESSLGQCTFRVVYQEDIVPRVPHLPAWHDPYRHVGTEVFISSVAGDLWFNPPLLRLLASDIWGIYRAFIVSKFAGALDPILDHHVNNYITALSKAAPIPQSELQTPK